MSKIRVLGNTRNMIKDVAQNLEDFVCSTMGPFGQNIALHDDLGNSVITKDGVTVAKAYEAESSEENLIASILKQAAEKTNSEAGDGTTTSTAIASAVIKEGGKLLDMEKDVNSVRKEISKACDLVYKYLKEHRVIFSHKPKDEVTDILYKIAMISTNGDETISRLIAEATAKAGELGLVSVKKGSLNYEIEQIPGMKIQNAGIAHAKFIEGIPSKKAILNNCYILITTHDLDSTAVIRDLQEKVLKAIISKNASLLIIPKSSDKGFLANMISFNATGKIKNVVTRPPYFGAVGREVMSDLAAMTGATIIDEAKGDLFANVELKHLGYAKEVHVDAQSTMIFSPERNEELLSKKIKELEKKAKELDGKKDNDKTLERLASLTGNFFTISIPSISEVEDKEKMDRIEDAINACKGALKEGYLPGGGTALLYSKAVLDEDNIYHKTFQKILAYPFKKILVNAGKTFEIIERDLSNGGNIHAYDVRNGIFGEPLEIGIIDSYRVVTSSLKNGVSVGLMLLTTAGILADKPVENINPFEFGY